jgi:hypothetical protein
MHPKRSWCCYSPTPSRVWYTWAGSIAYAHTVAAHRGPCDSPQVTENPVGVDMGPGPTGLALKDAISRSNGDRSSRKRGGSCRGTILGLGSRAVALGAWDWNR